MGKNWKMILITWKNITATETKVEQQVKSILEKQPDLTFLPEVLSYAGNNKIRSWRLFRNSAETKSSSLCPSGFASNKVPLFMKPKLGVEAIMGRTQPVGRTFLELQTEGRVEIALGHSEAGSENVGPMTSPALFWMTYKRMLRFLPHGQHFHWSPCETSFVVRPTLR